MPYLLNKSLPSDAEDLLLTTVDVEVAEDDAEVEVDVLFITKKKVGKKMIKAKQINKTKAIEILM